jgi:hypothetical protein
MMGQNTHRMLLALLKRNKKYGRVMKEYLFFTTVARGQQARQCGRKTGKK